MSAVIRRIAELDPSDADMLSALFGYLRTSGGHLDMGELTVFYDPDYTDQIYFDKGAWIVQRGFRVKNAYSTGQEALMVALRETGGLI